MKKAVVFASLFLSLLAEATIVVVTNGTEATVFCSANSSTVESLDNPFFAPDIETVVFSITNGLAYYPSQASTYTGGTVVQRGQLYINRGDALGTGPVRLGTENYEAALLVDGTHVVLNNKLVFGPKTCYALGMNKGPQPGSLTLKSIGVVETAETRIIRLGRASAGNAATVCLSLTEPDSEAVQRVNLSGALALTLDGGTVKAASDAQSPFFSMVYSSDEPDVTVTTNGVAVDVADGADIEFGVPLKFASIPEYTVLETYSPANNSFESGLSPWTIVATPPNTQTGEVRSNGSPFDTYNGTAWTTSDGSKYAMLRHDAVLSTSITVPTTGRWRVRFKLGCRPQASYSLGIRTEVKIDGETVHTVPKLSTLEERHPFEEVVTDPFDLSAGESHTLAFANIGGNADNSMNFDMVTLERVFTEYAVGTFSKVGPGGLTMSGQGFDGAGISVGDGTLTLYNSRLDDMDMAVSACTTGALHLAEIGSGAAVDVASGGTLALFCTGTNILVNPSFEANKVGFTAINPTGWTISVDPEYANANNTSSGRPASGVQMNGTSVSASGPHTPYGVVTAFLRENTKLSQSFSLVEAGSYNISYVQACRSYYTGYKMPLYVEVDGETVLSVPAHEDNYGYERHEVNVPLAAGSHVITFRSGRSFSGYQGEMVFIDDVSLRKIDSYPEIQGEIRMASGSTLVLDQYADFTIPYFYVDGVRINGRRGAIVRAGVAVSGAGSIRAGDTVGMQIILR